MNRPVPVPGEPAPALRAHETGAAARLSPQDAGPERRAAPAPFLLQELRAFTSSFC